MNSLGSEWVVLIVMEDGLESLLWSGLDLLMFQYIKPTGILPKSNQLIRSVPHITKDTHKPHIEPYHDLILPTQLPT